MAKRSRSDTVQLKLRIKEPWRAKVEAAAKARGVSLNAELADRIERSFSYEREYGGRETAALLRWLGAAAELTEARTGKGWLKDWGTYLAVREAWKVLIASAVPPEPKDWERSLEEAAALFPIPHAPPLPAPPPPGHSLEEQTAFEQTMTEWRADFERNKEWAREAEKKFDKAREDHELFLETPKRSAELGKEVAASVKKDMSETQDKH
jgi:hypothetical protein